MTVAKFWSSFLQETGRGPDTRCGEVFCFGWGEEQANQLLELVLSGKKRATTSCVKAYELEGEPLPQVGKYSVVTDWAGNPRCVIQTTAVTILPFRDMPFNICRREGEDESLETWRNVHREGFAAELRELGATFDESTPVLFEDFEVVFQGEQ